MLSTLPPHISFWNYSTTTTMLIYGVAEYTGKLTSEASLDFDIAGCNETKIDALARELGVPYRIFGVDDAAALRFGLDGICFVRNCAGPFAGTAEPMMDACIATDHLDITAEFKVYALAEAWSERAATAGVMLLCLASAWTWCPATAWRCRWPER